MNHLQRLLISTDSDSSHGDCHSDSDLDAILDATELDMGGQSCLNIPKNVSGLSDIERSESEVEAGSRIRKAKAMSSILMGGSIN